MVKSISITSPGIVRYPLHRHSFCEIMYYTEGSGFLKTEYGDYPFSINTAIIVPPNVLHGSVSENGFKNISVGGDFNNILIEDKPILINSSDDTATLCRLIYKNRFNSSDYLCTLVDCYTLALMQEYNIDSQIDTAVKKIISAISVNACNPEFSIVDELNHSGYTDDYIRAKFKEINKVTPTEFLNRQRIKTACHIIEIYGKRLTITEVAQMCGFQNSAYFSRIFKKYTGVSPSKYGTAGKRE